VPYNKTSNQKNLKGNRRKKKIDRKEKKQKKRLIKKQRRLPKTRLLWETDSKKSNLSVALSSCSSNVSLDYLYTIYSSQIASKMLGGKPVEMCG
jgi:hypothetical protein